MKTLFDPVLAHRNDPITSYEAADELIKSGKLADQEQQVLIALRRYPGLCSKELAAKSGLDRYTVARRLPGIRFKGCAQHCRVECCDHNPCRADCSRAQIDRTETRPGIMWWPRLEQRQCEK